MSRRSWSLPDYEPLLIEVESTLNRRRITLADGRYLIFYTFDEAMPATEEQEVGGERRSPQPQAVATEERSV